MTKGKGGREKRKRGIRIEDAKGNVSSRNKNVKEFGERERTHPTRQIVIDRISNLLHT